LYPATILTESFIFVMYKSSKLICTSVDPSGVGSYGNFEIL
jgi:hypothetical protein